MILSLSARLERQRQRQTPPVIKLQSQAFMTGTSIKRGLHRPLLRGLVNIMGQGQKVASTSLKPAHEPWSHQCLTTRREAGQNSNLVGSFLPSKPVVVLTGVRTWRVRPSSCLQYTDGHQVGGCRGTGSMGNPCSASCPPGN